MARRLAAGAVFGACLVGALCGLLAAAPAAGEERRVALALRGCEIALEARSSEPVLQLRPGRCAPSPTETREALRALLGRLYPAGRLGAVAGLSLGRIESLPWLSERLAAAALRAPGWDARSGRPRAGSPERFVAELLREQRLAAELVEALDLRRRRGDRQRREGARARAARRASPLRRDREAPTRGRTRTGEVTRRAARQPV